MNDEAALPMGALPLSQRLTVKILFSFISFLLLALASGVPFNGMFLYVLCAPEFIVQK